MATNTVISDPSMGDLRAMLANSDAPAAKETVTPETATTAEPGAEKLEAVAETAETKQEPEDKDEPLPKGVAKRIAKEVERQAEYDRQIAHAKSLTKAKEAELSAIAKPGSEPAQTTEATNGEPQEPTWAALSAQGKSWEEFEQALGKYKTDYREWLRADTKRTVQAELTQTEQRAAAQKRWDQAVKDHGAEFPKLMEAAQAIAPEGLQQAISALDEWSAVAVHLAKNPGQLKELSEAFEANPVRAIATLGRIEASLKTAPKTASPLPNPPAVVGGTASAGSAFDWEKSSMGALRAQVTKIRGR